MPLLLCESLPHNPAPTPCACTLALPANLHSHQNQAPESTADAVMKLRDHTNAMEKREEFISKKIDVELEKARMMSKKKDKRGALMALKKKKLYEQERNNLANSRFQLEQQIMTMEGARTNMETVKAMKQGATAMKDMGKELDIDNVDDVMDDVREQMDLANEIAEAVTQPMGGDMGYDDEDLEAEFAEMAGELDAEDLDAQLGGLDSVPTSVVATPAQADDPFAMPDVPSGLPAAAAPAGGGGGGGMTEEEKELAALEASMAM